MWLYNRRRYADDESNFYHRNKKKRSAKYSVFIPDADRLAAHEVKKRKLEAIDVDDVVDQLIAIIGRDYFE